jgi:hypothetical protein
LLIELESPQNINSLVNQEDIKNGERVRKFTVEGYSNNSWKILSEGSCIGHKRIITLDNSKVEKIKLTIQECIDEPQIKNFSIY